MYGFFGCTRLYGSTEFVRRVLVDATYGFAADDRVAVLAPAGSGKSTLVRLLGGLDRPDRGTVLRPPGVSWPLGFSGAFHPALSGEENVRLLARMMDADPDRVSAFVTLFSELGDDFYRPLQNYSSGMRGRLGFAFSMAIPQRFYLADEAVGLGDEQFRMKCERMLLRRLENAGLFLATRNFRIAERFAERFAVLENHRIVRCGSFDEARERFARIEQQEDDLDVLVAGLSRA
ncbi:putative capsule polysaccharide export ATP-binding protein [Caenibius tardaugens NBRC 16725]|uniref:Putative capsule polysaccharide export ATP-binding protein n=1 Tax=Caenibius tardaugens NBRC 16725 TaxID=1219035 RepID=U2ZY26_9SPHN|nr:ATP-binding cassette domain-containing protein [Caenibius tardaugens]AZI37318.1 ATP-binding cassette domain-containing protein [Caenibius tardaugens NBRC 16725]GAD47428.1 putative capsule polysaccharide export ATP-binding protein [Caenibius tardaugens NBRC 16725]